ncbi:hypothetical protein L1987_66080 [Smallanthus sonchifolius]|uniref:Uncharacterized protein n=1 Tax=Smallanthus sonchifolius TaxID=185202 RepID=A0ACB9BW92_9ASTR|nr:hypothetical protein L1987_66080 [Smallanthus sonchifolius]
MVFLVTLWSSLASNRGVKVPETTDEHSAMVSALIHVIRGGNDVNVVIVESLPERKVCGGCGMRITDECLGCDAIYTPPHVVEKRGRNIEE